MAKSVQSRAFCAHSNEKGNVSYYGVTCNNNASWVGDSTIEDIRLEKLLKQILPNVASAKLNHDTDYFEINFHPNVLSRAYVRKMLTRIHNIWPEFNNDFLSARGSKVKIQPLSEAPESCKEFLKELLNHSTIH